MKPLTLILKAPREAPVQEISAWNCTILHSRRTLQDSWRDLTRPPRGTSIASRREKLIARITVFFWRLDAGLCGTNGEGFDFTWSSRYITDGEHNRRRTGEPYGDQAGPLGSKSA